MSRVSVKVVQSENGSGLMNFTEVCNCQAKAYALAFNVDLVGLCSALDEVACFSHNAYTQLSKEDFLCDEKYIC